MHAPRWCSAGMQRRYRWQRLTWNMRVNSRAPISMLELMRILLSRIATAPRRQDVMLIGVSAVQGNCVAKFGVSDCRRLNDNRELSTCKGGGTGIGPEGVVIVPRKERQQA